jgi:hypothetical protein
MFQNLLYHGWVFNTGEHFNRSPTVLTNLYVNVEKLVGLDKSLTNLLSRVSGLLPFSSVSAMSI